MKISIFYFSQTGNTRKVAKEMARVCSEAKHTVQTIAFKKATHNDFVSADLIGVGVPCFESQAPSPVRKYLYNLPPMRGKKAFVFSTAGGAPGRVLWDLTKPLQSKGALVIGGFLCRGTCYYPIPCLVGRFPDRPDESDLENARRFTTSLLQHAAADTPGPMADSRPDTFHHGFGLYNIMGSILKEPLIRMVMPKPKADDRCNTCGWCVKDCPTNSITLAPRPEIAVTCIRCYRCMTGCPEKALAVNWGASNFITWTLYNTVFERWFGDVRSGEKFY